MIYFVCYHNRSLNILMNFLVWKWGIIWAIPPLCLSLACISFFPSHSERNIFNHVFAICSMDWLDAITFHHFHHIYLNLSRSGMHCFDFAPHVDFGKHFNFPDTRRTFFQAGTFLNIRSSNIKSILRHNSRHTMTYFKLLHHCNENAYNQELELMFTNCTVVELW